MAARRQRVRSTTEQVGAASQEIRTGTLDTRCANGAKSDFVVAVSNLPTGDLAVLDADYDFRLVKQRP